MGNFKRKISANEILYNDYNQLYSTLDIQFIIEGVGNIDNVIFERAVKIASNACPGAKSILKDGFWIDEGEVPIHYSKENNFNRKTIEDLIVKDRKLDYENKAAAEIWVLGKENPSFIFRVFHGAMDGKAVLSWVTNIFKVLRNEETTEYLSTENDLSFLSTVNSRKKGYYLIMDKKVCEKIDSSKLGVLLRRISINGYKDKIVSRVAEILTDELNLMKGKFLIPIDIRRHNKEIKSTANLTLPIFLKTRKNEKYTDINSRLLKDLMNNEELNINSANFSYLTELNENIRRKIIKFTFLVEKKLNRFAITGILSDLGKIDAECFNTKTFGATNFYSIPVQQVFSPISMVASKFNGKSEIIFSTYDSFFNKDDFNKLISNIEKRLINNQEELVGRESNIPKTNFIENLKNPLYSKNIALYFNQYELTYKELDCYSDILAVNLKKRFVKERDQLLIYCERSEYFIISILASIKVGAIYIPLDSNSKLNDTALNSISLILVDNRNSENLLIKGKNKIIIDKIDYGKHENFNYKLENDEDIIYKIYTSGSTGEPKAVNISYGAIKNYLYWAKDEYNVGTTSVFPLFTSISVDLTLTSIFLPLLFGGAIEIYNENFDNKLIKKLLSNKRINIIKMTPTHLKLFNNFLEGFEKVKLFIIGGEQLPHSECIKLFKKNGNDIRIINEYGPTEATVGCVYKEIKNDYKNDVIPIGFPIYNTKIIVDYNNHGYLNGKELGEIIIVGNSLANGYDNLEMTKEKFFYLNNELAYKTGDLAYVNKEDGLIYAGRCDSQVKINGKRIELGYIENIINSNENIKNSVVLYSEDINDIKIFNAYCVLNKNDQFNEENLREYLSGFLEVSIIPKNIFFIEDIPLNINGKLDKKRVLELKGKEEFKYLDEGLSKIKISLIELWKDILELTNDFNYESEFYMLGGDSVAFITMITFIIERYIKTHEEEEFLRELECIQNSITINSLESLIKKFV